MKRKHEVRWYEYNLTQEKSRKFFTDFAANFYAWYIEYKYGAKVWILNHE